MRKLTAICIVLLTCSRLYGQETPPKPLVTTPVAPVNVTLRDDGCFFIDFGRDAFAQFKLQLDIPGGEQVTARLGEKLKTQDHIDSKPPGSVRFLQTTIRDGFAALPGADARRMPQKIGSVMPFRYVELEGLPHGTTTDDVVKAARQIRVNYPFDDNAAEFSCSNDKLNAIWNFSKYSIKATSFAGVFVDGDRERKPYEADAYINGLGWYCTTGDLTLPPYTDRYLIDHPTWPTEWMMFSVLCAWNDYLYTGDLQALRKSYPELKIKCLRDLEREDGLITTKDVPPAVSRALHLASKEKLRDIVDWPVTERDGYEMGPLNTVVNAFHCRSLLLIAKMAAALGNESDAADFQAASEKTLASLNRKLFDPGTGLYVDAEGSIHSSQHANMFPLAFGLVPTDRRAKVTEFVKSRSMACSVYGAQFLLDGLFDNAAGDAAVDLMLAPGDRSWRHMVEDTGTTITLEAWDQKYKPNQDWNHGWGAAPANLIPRKVLGVEPAVPGFSEAIIWPRCAGKSGLITWARGKVPTIKGPVAVDWKATPEGLSVNMELPVGMKAKIRLPSDWGDHIIFDGKQIPAAGSDGTLSFDAGSGKHTVLLGK